MNRLTTEILFDIATYGECFADLFKTGDKMLQDKLSKIVETIHVQCFVKKMHFPNFLLPFKRLETLSLTVDEFDNMEQKRCDLNKILLRLPVSLKHFKLHSTRSLHYPYATIDRMVNLVSLDLQYYYIRDGIYHLPFKGQLPNRLEYITIECGAIAGDLLFPILPRNLKSLSCKGVGFRDYKTQFGMLPTSLVELVLEEVTHCLESYERAFDHSLDGADFDHLPKGIERLSMTFVRASRTNLYNYYNFLPTKLQHFILQFTDDGHDVPLHTTPAINLSMVHFLPLSLKTMKLGHTCYCLSDGKIHETPKDYYFTLKELLQKYENTKK